MKTVAGLVLGLLFTVMIVGTMQASAIPSANLRLFITDPEGFETGGGTAVRSISPLDANVFTTLNAEGTLNFGERIINNNDDVFVADENRISRITLDSNGLPSINNVDYLTESVFGTLVGIDIDSSGIIYVADSSDNTIYAVNPNDPLPATPTIISNDNDFVSLQDIAIYNDQLYVLDTGVGGGNGAIFKIDLTAPILDTTDSAILVFSDSGPSFSLGEASAIAVSGDAIYISGHFITPHSAIIKIDTTDNSKTQFLNNGLSYPSDLTVDEAGNDLYVVDSGSQTIFRSDLTTPSLTAIPTSGTFTAPTGIATFLIQGSLPNVNLSMVKQVNATIASPGSALLYTLTATNDGPDPVHNTIIHDHFPDQGANTVESYLLTPLVPSSLYYTSEVHNATGTFVLGSCARLTNDAFNVDCSGFGTLNPGDFVVIHLIGIVNQAADGQIRNTAVVEEPGIASDTGFVDSTVVPSIGLSLNKIASTDSVTAGLDSIEYTITVSNPTPSNANNVLVTDKLPSGTSSLTVVSQPTPNSCQIISNLDGTNELHCGPYDLVNTVGAITISYSANVDSDATNPLTNMATVICDNCPSQTKTVETEVLRESDISIQKESETSVNAGESLLYTITITNDETSPSNADNIVVTDHLPAGVTFNAADSSPTCSFDSQNNNVICTLAESLPPGGSSVLTIKVDVNPDTVGTLINTASVASGSSDNTPENNQVTGDEVTVVSSADLIISKTAVAETVAGRVITYQISVTNAGPSTAVDIHTEDPLPAGLSFIPASPTSQTDPDCHDESGTIFCDFGNMAPGTETKSIQALIGLTVTGDITNQAEVFSETDSTTENNISTATTTVLPPFCGRAESDFAHVITGTAGNDVLMGTNDDDLILGLGGNDKIHGKKGNDCIIGGDGDDKIWGGEGNDTIEGNTGNNEIHGQQGNDIITSGDGDDKIWGGQGKDTINAGNGNNQIHGNQDDDIITSGDGDDKIWGGQGKDTINAGNGNNKLDGNQDDDNITSGTGNDWISGGEGNDNIHAGSGSDKIFGRQGNDNLYGESGNDIINGGQGNDLLNGGPDNDQCDGAQGTNTFVDCEVKKPVKEEDGDDDQNEEDEGHDHDEDNHGNDNHGH